MTCGIYKIIYDNKLVYIGSSKNIARRWRDHRGALKRRNHKNFLLQRVYDKYGIDVLDFSIVEECLEEVLNDREQFYIDTLKPLFNLSDAYGRHSHTEEAKAKMRGRVVSEETRKKMSEQRKGKPSRLKGIKTGRVPRSAFKKGLIPWNKGKKLKPSWNAGKHLSEEQKIKIKISCKISKRGEIND